MAVGKDSKKQTNKHESSQQKGQTHHTLRPCRRRLLALGRRQGTYGVIKSGSARPPQEYIEIGDDWFTTGPVALLCCFLVSWLPVPTKNKSKSIRCVRECLPVLVFDLRVCLPACLFVCVRRFGLLLAFVSQLEDTATLACVHIPIYV